MARVAPVVLAIFLVLAAPVSAAEIDVNTEADVVADDGACSLREAITAANQDDPSGTTDGECDSGAAADFVNVPPGEYVLEIDGRGEDANATGDLDITSAVSIVGAGADLTTIDGDERDRVLHFLADSGSVSLVTITNGLTADGDDRDPAPDPGAGGNAEGDEGGAGEPGGGILVEIAATVAIGACRIVDNHTGDGGRGGDATGGNATAGANENGGDGEGGNGGDGGDGGGVASFGNLTIIDCVVADNGTGGGGDGGNGQGGDGSGAAAGNAQGATGGVGDGGRGGEGGYGGGIFTDGVFSILDSTVVANATGDGGAGNDGIGGAGGPGSGTAAGGTGGSGAAGDGGEGGAGGGLSIDLVNTGNILRTTIRGNLTGDGGDAESGQGGDGGAGGPSDGGGGSGGGGSGGEGGEGGPGGGIDANGDPLGVIASTITDNLSGTGGLAGDGVGGDGAAASGNGIGGLGGPGQGGPGAEPGHGAGIRLDDEGTISRSTISGNETGEGSDGGDGTGGEGGAGPGDTGGNGGDGFAGSGADGGDGGGLLAQEAATLRHVTVAFNTSANGGVAGTATAGQGGPGIGDGQPGGTTAGTPGLAGFSGGLAGENVDIGATLVTDNGPNNCDPDIDDSGQNVSFPDTSCPGDDGDPLLGPLADNGGSTPTHLLLAGSSALDGSPTAAPHCDDDPADQRGFSRPVGAACDIGAVETGIPSATTGDASAVTAESASIEGSVSANGRSTTYRFDYGTTDGYGLSTPETPVGSDVSADLTGLAPSTTYHYRIVAVSSDGVAVGDDRTFTTGALPGPGPGPGPGPLPPPPLDTTAPRFLSASLTRARFAINPSGAREVAVSAQTTRRGTTFRYQLSEAARVVFTIRRARPGRRVRGRCRAPSRSNRRRPRCTRYIRVAAFAQDATAAVMTKSFSGRIGSRRLRPGRYRAVLVATDAAGNRSAARRLTFSVVRPRV